MRTVVIVVVVLGAVVFLGGAVNIGGAPIFEHLDALIGHDVFMDVHYTLFGFLQRGRATIEDPAQRVGDKIDEFSKKPFGIDHSKKYRQLDKASGN